MESYERRGVLQYLAAWDVHQGVPWGHGEAKMGMAAFGRPVDLVTTTEPYRLAPRVFWVVEVFPGIPPREVLTPSPQPSSTRWPSTPWLRGR